MASSKAIDRNNELYDYAAENADRKVMSIGEIAGVVVGVLAVCAIAITVAAVVIKKKNKAQAVKREAEECALSEKELFGDGDNDKNGGQSE